MGVPDNGFHLLDIVLYASQPETVESQLIHRLQHMWMDKIALKTDMIVMMDIVRLACQHLHEKIIAAMEGMNVQIDQGIHTGSFDDMLLVCVCIILREGQVMGSSQDQYRLSDVRKLFDHCLQCCIGIGQGGP